MLPKKTCIDLTNLSSSGKAGFAFAFMKCIWPLTLQIEDKNHEAYVKFPLWCQGAGNGAVWFDSVNGDSCLMDINASTQSNAIGSSKEH
ncbi:Lysosomal acid alpha-glucosidase [Trichinella pseudospiralis]